MITKTKTDQQLNVRDTWSDQVSRTLSYASPTYSSAMLERLLCLYTLHIEVGAEHAD